MRHNLAGRRFGRLVAVERATNVKSSWLCVCDCGNTKTVTTGGLVGGRSNSCGCYRREWAKAKRTKHGQSRTPLHGVWKAMIRRCHNPNETCFANYGGRGIQVCERWRTSFEEFAEDIGPPPATGMSIDRIDVNGNYEPGNVRWATRVEQARNMRKNKTITVDGETLTLAGWAERLGLNYSRVQRWAEKNIQRNGNEGGEAA